MERQTIDGARQSVVRYRYEAGAAFPVHAHPEEQITLLLRGRLTFEINGQRYEVGAGEVLVVPGGVHHGAWVVGDDVVETLNTLAPRRMAPPLPPSVHQGG